MGQTIKWMFEKRRAMKEDFDHVLEVLAKIETKVHPLNKELCMAVQSSVSHSESSKIIFTEKERP